MADKKDALYLKKYSIDNRLLLNDLHVISQKNGRNL